MARRRELDEQFDELVRARVAHLRRVAFLVLHDWQLAEDAVQAALLKVYLRWTRIRPETREAYVRTAVVNASLTALKRRKREIPSYEVPDVAVVADDGADLSAALTVLSQLPPSQRAVLALRFLDDLSVSEVAQVLDISEGAVKSQTSRGLTKLRSAITHQALMIEGRQT